MVVFLNFEMKHYCSNNNSKEVQVTENKQKSEKITGKQFSFEP